VRRDPTTRHLLKVQDGVGGAGHLIRACSATIPGPWSTRLSDHGVAHVDYQIGEFMYPPAVPEPGYYPWTPEPDPPWQTAYDKTWGPSDAPRTDYLHDTGNQGAYAMDAGFCTGTSNSDPWAATPPDWHLYRTLEANIEGWGTQYGVYTGGLDPAKLSNVKLVLEYDVFGAQAWAPIGLQLRISDTEFDPAPNGGSLEPARTAGTQKTSWQENADQHVRKEIALQPSDLFTGQGEQTVFLVMPVENKPAFPNNDGDFIDVGIANLTFDLQYTVGQ